jgi:hypothetical protein
VSKIWDSLQDVERHENKRDYKEGVQNCDLIPDRRSTKRLWAYTPVLVYGYGAADNPFHEGTEALHVNARGGLITLSTAVNPGQTLLLINKVNLKEQKCSVVRRTSPYLNRTPSSLSFRNQSPILGTRLAAEVARRRCALDSSPAKPSCPLAISLAPVHGRGDYYWSL